MKKPITKIINKGFTLVECVIAIALVGLLLTGVVAVLAPAADDIDEAISREQATAIINAFVEEVSTTREPNPNGNSGGIYDGWAIHGPKFYKFGDPYSKALSFIKLSNSSSPHVQHVVVYKTNTSLTETTKEMGHFKPVNINTMDNPVLGVDYTTQFRVRRLQCGEARNYKEADPGFITGAAYLLKFRPYVRSGSDLVLGNYGDISTFTPEGATASNPDGTSFAVQVEVYRLNKIDISGIELRATISDINAYQDSKGFIRPVFKTNLSFRR